MKAFISTMLIAGICVAGSAGAVEMPKEGKLKCGGCHTIDRKMVGPAWNDVAKKYAGKAGAEKTLIANITKGGEFGWKMGKMLPRGMGASDDEIKSLAKFILKLK